MAEHEEIVSRAAEAAAKACLRNPGAVYVSDVAELLSPFFAAARKEAREELLDELAGHLPSEFIRTLRSKPKEPA